MWNIHSFNFTLWNAAKTDMKKATEQIDAMVDECAINTVNIAIGAHQSRAQSLFRSGHVQLRQISGAQCALVGCL